MLSKLFGLKRAPDEADRLYAQAVAQARDPRFYLDLGVPDRIDARFELHLLHVVLLVRRLRAEGEAGADLGQRLFDVFVSALDNDLRELGVGDLSVPKKMRKLGEQAYGRMKIYEPALETGDVEALTEAFSRNVAPEAGPERMGRLAAYAVASVGRLADQPWTDLARRPAWAEIV